MMFAVRTAAKQQPPPDLPELVEARKGELARHDYQFSTLILEITRSAPFQMRRGDGSQVAQGP